MISAQILEGTPQYPGRMPGSLMPRQGEGGTNQPGAVFVGTPLATYEEDRTMLACEYVSVP
jgi:hypothetical protein